MEKREEAGRESRRKFLKSMALTGGGVAVTAKMGQAFAADAEPDAPSVQEPTGYHETQHIRDYYAKAEF